MDNIFERGGPKHVSKKQSNSWRPKQELKELLMRMVCYTYFLVITKLVLKVYLLLQAQQSWGEGNKVQIMMQL